MESKNKKTRTHRKNRLNLWLLEGKSGEGWGGLEEVGQIYKLPVIK